VIGGEEAERLSVASTGVHLARAYESASAIAPPTPLDPNEKAPESVGRLSRVEKASADYQAIEEVGRRAGSEVIGETDLPAAGEASVLLGMRPSNPTAGGEKVPRGAGARGRSG
jgi:hypothetical protein